MTDEVKAVQETQEVQKTQEEKAAVVVAVETQPAPIPAPANLKLDPKEENKKLQGKKATSKKKINKYTPTEIYVELKRLEKAGHQQSIYYRQLQERVGAV